MQDSVSVSPILPLGKRENWRSGPEKAASGSSPPRYKQQACQSQNEYKPPEMIENTDQAIHLDRNSSMQLPENKNRCVRLPTL
jgi:hypothetical protein